MENAVEQFKLLIKQIILNFKYVFHNKKNMLLFVLLPLAALSMPVILVPVQFSFPSYVSIGVIAPASLLYCATTFEWRKGTLYPNLLTSKNNKYQFYISSFIVMLIVAITLYIASMVVLTLLNNIGMLHANWGFGGTMERYIKFDNWYLIPAVYTIFEASLIMFSILFFVQNITNTNVVLYVVVFSILSIQVIFGGTFTQFFLRARKYTTDDGIKYAFPEYHALAFPDSSYWFANIIDPLFAPSMHMQAFSSKWMYNFNDNLSTFNDDHHFRFWIWETSKNTFGLLTNDQMYRWNSLWLTTYVWVGAFGISGALCSHYKK